jgi:hypothetical protein
MFLWPLVCQIVRGIIRLACEYPTRDNSWEEKTQGRGRLGHTNTRAKPIIYYTYNTYSLVIIRIASRPYGGILSERGKIPAIAAIVCR